MLFYVLQVVDAGFPAQGAENTLVGVYSSLERAQLKSGHMEANWEELPNVTKTRKRWRLRPCSFGEDMYLVISELQFG